MNSLEEFYINFREEIEKESINNNCSMLEEFVIKSAEILENANEIDEFHGTTFKKTIKRKNILIDGYSLDEVDNTLSLVIFDFSVKQEIENLSNSSFESLYTNLYNFLYFITDDHESIEDYCDSSDEIIDFVKMIRRNIFTQNQIEQINKINLVVVTNKKKTGILKDNKLAEIKGKMVKAVLWDLEKFNDYNKSLLDSHIVVNFQNDFEYEGIPCVKANLGENLDFDSYIGIIPGKILADLYIEYGSKILEGNVRAFLGNSGGKGVNNGIKKTIENEPTKFLALTQTLG